MGPAQMDEFSFSSIQNPSSSSSTTSLRVLSTPLLSWFHSTGHQSQHHTQNGLAPLDLLHRNERPRFSRLFFSPFVSVSCRAHVAIFGLIDFVQTSDDDAIEIFEWIRILEERDSRILVVPTFTKMPAMASSREQWLL